MSVIGRCGLNSGGREASEALLNFDCVDKCGCIGELGDLSTSGIEHLAGHLVATLVHTSVETLVESSLDSTSLCISLNQWGSVDRNLFT